MNAEEAKKISEENKLSLEQVLIHIEREAKNGFNNYTSSQIKFECIAQLMKLSFNIREQMNSFNGIKEYIISW